MTIEIRSSIGIHECILEQFRYDGWQMGLNTYDVRKIDIFHIFEFGTRNAVENCMIAVHHCSCLSDIHFKYWILDIGYWILAIGSAIHAINTSKQRNK